MAGRPYSCNQAKISRFLDGETSPAESQRIEEHLQTCPEYRRELTRLRETGGMLRQVVKNARKAMDFPRLEQQILTAARNHDSLKRRLQANLLSWKLAIPTTAAAALLVLFIFNPFQPPLSSGPSAIIDSFTGQVKSVMILETPQKHQTVIWYTEENKAENAPNPTHT